MGVTIFRFEKLLLKESTCSIHGCFSSLRYIPVYKQDIPQLLEIIYILQFNATCIVVRN